MPEPPEPRLHQERSSDPRAYQRMIQQLRDASGFRIEEVGLRQTALEIGMSPTGLANFINGAEPQMRTVHKIRKWHSARSAQGEENT